MLAPESKTKSGIALRVLSPGGLSPAPIDSSMPTAELSAVGICLPAERLRELEQRRGAQRAPSRCRGNKRQRLDKHAKHRLYWR